MEIQVNQEVIDTVCNSLRASKQSLRNRLARLEGASRTNEKEILSHQLIEVQRALEVFQTLES